MPAITESKWLALTTCAGHPLIANPGQTQAFEVHRTRAETDPSGIFHNRHEVANLSLELKPERRLSKRIKVNLGISSGKCPWQSVIELL